jgi:hypothetical protein
MYRILLERAAEKDLARLSSGMHEIEGIRGKRRGGLREGVTSAERGCVEDHP